MPRTKCVPPLLALASSCLAALFFCAPAAGQSFAQHVPEYERAQPANAPLLQWPGGGEPVIDDEYFASGTEQAPWRPWLPSLHYAHGDPNDPARHIGWGLPLEGTSWLNRPYHADYFFGALFGDALIAGRVRQGGGTVSGVRLGWDLDHYWGLEARVGFSNLPLTDRAGLQNELRFGDVSFQYYPWGDSHWRPFFLLGAGAAEFQFVDDLGQTRDEVLFQVPIGGGLKYYFRNWLALRVDVFDNVALGMSGLDTMNNLSVSGGFEFRFGGSRTSYFPWDDGIRPR